MFDARVIYLSMSLTPSLVNGQATSEQTFSNINGIEAGDTVVCVNKPTHQANLGIVNYRVPGAGQLAITYMNTSGSGITPTSETYKVGIMKSQPTR